MRASSALVRSLRCLPLACLVGPVISIGLSSGTSYLAVASPHAKVRADGPTVKFVLENNATISDTISVRARVTAADDTGIEKVEFYLDDKLKVTDSSTPYEFEWNTLDETEGEHTLSVTAFDSKGGTAKAKITVSIDNELSKGADAHAETALAALKAGNVEKATKYAKRALKIAPGNLRAARAYAGILHKQGRLDEAITVMEKVELPENEVDARADLVALYMEHGDASDSTAGFLKDAAAAAEQFKKLQAIRAENAAKGAGDADTYMKVGDAELAGRRWNAALLSYQKCGASDTAPVECVNRQILAYLMSGRNANANVLIRDLTRNKRNDVITRVLLAASLLIDHQAKKAREMVQDDVDNKVLPALIVAAYADIAQKQNKRATDEMEAAYAIAPTLPEVLLLRAYLTPDASDARREAVRALARNPIMTEGYVLRGYQILLSTDPKRFESADQALDFALQLEPNNVHTMMAKSLSYLAQKRTPEAEPLLMALAEKDKSGADIHVAQALNYSLQDKSIKITPEMDTAHKLDPDFWTEFSVPKPMELVSRVYKFRVVPFLTPDSFNPPK